MTTPPDTYSTPSSPRRHSLGQVLAAYALLVVFSIFALYPLTQIITISLRPSNQLLSTSLALIPQGATFESYVKLLFETDYLRWLLNSTLIALTVTVTGVAIASTAAYGLSRFRFWGRNAILSGLLITQMFPATMLLLPLYLMLIQLGLINSYLGVIVIYLATALPFCVWQLKGYYDTIPTSLEEAALIDGCTPWQTFRKIVLPLAAPGLAITALFSFMTAWNEYVVAALVLQETHLFTLPMGLRSFMGNMNTEWGLYAAGALIVSVPAVTVFLLVSRFLVSGLTAGGVKE
ncbi:MAG: sugar ABC transporter permease [Methylacidiphilales bacterium]|nr:sugar ABC transporter permease [Candidatus Methylacidiphilales bacterium]MDW8350070.1 sugar ABC transporter permease [Verrucomicrobiae bacterium]